MTSKKPANCHDCVYAEWQEGWIESRCELSKEWVGNGSFAEECEDFEYAWDDRDLNRQLKAVEKDVAE